MDAKKVNIFHVERIAYLAAALQVGRPESLAGSWLVQFSPFGRLCRAAFDELLNRWTIASCAETHSSLVHAEEISPKIVADQQGHTVDVNQNIYTQSPLEIRREAVERIASPFVN